MQPTAIQNIVLPFLLIPRSLFCSWISFGSIIYVWFEEFSDFILIGPKHWHSFTFFSRDGFHNLWFSSVQLLSRVQLFATPWITARQASLSINQLPEFTQTHIHRVSDAIQASHPLSSPSPPAPNPSQQQGLFQWVNSLHEVAKILEFQLQYQPSNQHPGLISLRMDWLDRLAVQGTLKSLLQHHTSKASILRCSAFFTVRLSHPYMTTGKTIALTRQTFVGKVVSLLLNMLPRLVIAFLPRSKHLLISWLQLLSAVILEPP